MKKVITFRICAEWFEKLRQNIVENRFREAMPHWQSRLLEKDGNFKKFDEIRIVNGYSKTSPTAIVEFGGIESTINSDGIPGFEIKLGKIVEILEEDEK